MVIEIKLLKSKKETDEGFPLAVQISHQNNRKTKNIAFCKESHFIKDGKTISDKHPDYDILAPIYYGNKDQGAKIDFERL